MTEEKKEQRFVNVDAEYLGELERTVKNHEYLSGYKDGYKQAVCDLTDFVKNMHTERSE